MLDILRPVEKQSGGIDELELIIKSEINQN
jgi:hypothetical protein